MAAPPAGRHRPGDVTVGTLTLLWLAAGASLALVDISTSPGGFRKLRESVASRTVGRPLLTRAWVLSVVASISVVVLFVFVWLWPLFLRATLRRV